MIIEELHIIQLLFKYFSCEKLLFMHMIFMEILFFVEVFDEKRNFK